MKRALGKMVAGNMLTTAALRDPDGLATVCVETGRRFSFGAFDIRANRLANALADAGLAKGDACAFLVANRAEVPEIYFALARSGIIGVPLNYRLAPAELDALMGALDVSALIYEDRFEEEAAQCQNARQLRIRIGAAGPGVSAYEDLLAAASPNPPAIEIEEADPFYFNLTSGTTGLPKAYVLTQYNNATFTPLFAAMDMSSDDVAMTVFPAFGRVGFAWIGAGLIYSIPNILMNFEPTEVLCQIEAERVTILNLVPTMAAMLLQAQEEVQADLSSLRGIVFAGSSLPDPIAQRTRSELCPNLYEYYGMQESGALVASTPHDREIAPGSVGKPILFSELRVVDDTGRNLPAGETGEILGRSPCSVTEYFDNPKKSAETFRDGWIHTGDLGSVDERGYLTILGRKKDMIITGGQNVHAAEVEEILLACEGVEDCAVFGLPDDYWGEAVCALVVTADGTIDASALERHCRQQLAGFKMPKRFFTDSAPLPRTPTGKVQKFLLVERFSAAENTQ